MLGTVGQFVTTSDRVVLPKVLLAEAGKFPELAEFLFRDNSFPAGAYLMTGTGIVPPDSFTLRPGDEIRISVGPIGTLVNTVA